MSPRARWEAVALVVLLLVLLAFAIPAFLHARAEVRDDLRRDDLTNLKRELEQYNNKFKVYPAISGGQEGCTPKGSYTYCVTQVEAGQTVGFYVEAQLEVPQPDTIGFDEDESRKFAYRIINENHRTLYRVCGGTETQCGQPDSN